MKRQRRSCGYYEKKGHAAQDQRKASMPERVWSEGDQKGIAGEKVARTPRYPEQSEGSVKYMRLGYSAKLL